MRRIFVDKFLFGKKRGGGKCAISLSELESAAQILIGERPQRNASGKNSLCVYICCSKFPPPLKKTVTLLSFPSALAPRNITPLLVTEKNIQELRLSAAPVTSRRTSRRTVTHGVMYNSCTTTENGRGFWAKWKQLKEKWSRLGINDHVLVQNNQTAFLSINL